MITKQRLEIVDRNTMEMRLVNTYDTSVAIETAKMVSDNGGRGNGDMMPLGYIPPEEWQWNPWLREANKARMAGDMGEFTTMMLKFFKLFPQYAVLHTRKYY